MIVMTKKHYQKPDYKVFSAIEQHFVCTSSQELGTSVTPYTEEEIIW